MVKRVANGSEDNLFKRAAGVARVVSRMGSSDGVDSSEDAGLVVLAGIFSAADSSAEEESVKICSTGSRMSSTMDWAVRAEQALRLAEATARSRRGRL
jgi:hypothetical protein